MVQPPLRPRMTCLTPRGRLMRCPRKKSMKKLKDAIRQRTHRNNGKSLQQIIVGVNAVTRGWFEYYKHSNRTTFDKLDAWIRMRLRSIVRKRRSRKGPGAEPTISAGRTNTLRSRGFSPLSKPVKPPVNPLDGNLRPESRMRENRLSGSEGGVAQSNVPFLPLSSCRRG